MADPSSLVLLDPAEPSCPTPSVLAAYAEGSLGASEGAAVAAHVKSCEECDLVVGVFATPDPETSTGAGTGASVEAFFRRASLATQLAPGTKLGRFRVLSSVGRGAMGVVYAAHDDQLDRKVALKVLLDDRGELVTEGRLLREARSMARLDHPNIVTVFEVGAADGRVFLAMQLVEGSTLAEWLARGQPPRRVLSLFVDVARALEAAHHAGVVHRDLKPQNILVSKAGDAKVTDFGLADTSAALAEAAPATSIVATTRTRGVVGTPAYMAPEVLLGVRGTARSDQFSFAVCLHEALTGRRPYDARTLEELEDVVRRDALRIAPELEPPIARVLQRALARDPDARFPSMAELAAELAGAEPAEAVPLPSRRARAGTWLAAGLVGIAAVGTAFGLSRRAAPAGAPPAFAMPAEASVTRTEPAPRPPAEPAPPSEPGAPSATRPRKEKGAERRAASSAAPVASTRPTSTSLEAEGPKGTDGDGDWLRMRR